jgi:glutamyl-Q tRNA(Asp) synthetase
MSVSYVGRFAPSPTGPMHLGTLQAALASYLDAKAHDGRWIVRMEDVDLGRCSTEYAKSILSLLQAYGMESDKEVIYQSERNKTYCASLQLLWARGLLYYCNCTRKIIQTLPKSELTNEPVYGGKCQKNLMVDFDVDSSLKRAIRLTCKSESIEWTDFFQHKEFSQNILIESGDLVLKRADGCFSYCFAVVVDDYLQHVTHVVRGEDIAPITHRQIYLQRLLNFTSPKYAHIPVVLEIDTGRKMSKQNNSIPISPLDWKKNLTECARNLMKLTDLHTWIKEPESPKDYLNLLIKIWKSNKIINWV